MVPWIRTALGAVLCGWVGVADLPADPLDTWHVRSSGTGVNLNAVTHGAGLFVAVGQSGTIVMSGDGTNWTLSVSGVHTNLNDVCWGVNRFIVVGEGGTMLQSSNGVHWTQQPSVTSEDLNAVKWLDGRFLAVGGTGTLLDSADGQAWTPTDLGISYGLKSLAYGNGVFCVGAESFSNNGLISTSPDGITWSNQLGNGFFTLYDMVFGHGRFVALCIRGQTRLSSDGWTWTQGQAGNTDYLFGITYAQDRFVAVGGPYGGGSQKIVTSADGIHWEQRFINTGYSPSLMSVAYGNGSFMAVGGKGLILQSDPYWKLRVANPPTPGASLQWIFTGEANRDYRLQCAGLTSGLVWSNLFGFTSTNETILLTDPTAGNAPTRVYRVVSP